MNTLLIFFALPVATIILSIVLQKILKNPLLVPGTFFAIYLIVAFAFSDSSFLVLTILYTILAYLTAVLTKWICCLLERLKCGESDRERIVETPITINNTSPCNSINLTGDARIVPNTNCRNNGRKL